MTAIAADRGLPLDVFKARGQSFSNGGLSERYDEATLVAVRNVDGVQSPVPKDCQVFSPRDDAPAVVLVAKKFTFGTYLFVEPLERGEGAGPMMGGCYVATSDSRFGKLAGGVRVLPLHDRYERQVQA